MKNCGLVVAALGLALQPTMATGQTRDTAARRSSVDGFTLAFVDADAKRVVDAVLGAMLAVDYSVDPAVQGTITLRTAQPVTREQLVPLLEGALRSIGAVMIVEQGRYRVLPRAAALSQAPVADNGRPANTVTSDPSAISADTSSADTSPGFATEVITLRSASAPQIARLIEQFVGDGVVASVEPQLNRIVITGSGSERSAARQLIARFDVDTLAGMQFELIRLDNVDAQTLVDELDRIFEPPFDIIGSRVRVVPLPRLRSVLLIAADRADIGRMQPWITRLDTGGAGKRRLYSYAVQNGRARDMARILSRVLGTSGNDETTAEEPAGRVVPVPSGDNEPPQPSETASLTATPNGGRDRAAPRVIASDETNSLLIYADGEEYEFIRDALTRLDQPVPQVLIEAILAEVTLTQDLQFGVNFRALQRDITASNSNAATGTPTSVFPGFSASWVGSSASAILNTLQSRTNVRIISSPKLVVLNNQTATLQVGDQVPIVTQQVQSTVSSGAPVVNNIELRDTGVILRVTPRVNESGTVTLDISQEVSDVARTTTSGINSPTIQQRRIASVVATRSGEMVALGGLIRDRSSTGRSGIPLLSQIPIVGGLFGNQTRESSRTELIILMTPTVIRAPQDSQAIVRDLIDDMAAVGRLLPDDVLPPPAASPP